MWVTIVLKQSLVGVLDSKDQPAHPTTKNHKLQRNGQDDVCQVFGVNSLGFQSEAKTTNYTTRTLFCSLLQFRTEIEIEFIDHSHSQFDRQL